MKQILAFSLSVAIIAMLAFCGSACSTRAVADEPKQNGPAPPGGRPADVDRQIREAYQLQIKSEWSAAAKKWKELAKNKALSSRQRTEVEQNLELAEKLTVEPEQRWERPKGDKDKEGKPAAPIPQAALMEQYPEGRTVSSLAIFEIKGTGINDRWYLKAHGNFVFEVQVRGRSCVIENTGRRMLVEIQFDEVVQLLAVSKVDKLEIKWPSRLLATADLVAENTIPWPAAYRAIRGTVAELEKLDPGFSNTFTEFAKHLEAGGVKVVDTSAVFDWAAQIHQLSGKKLRVHYVPALGITQIDVLNDKTLPRETLANLAHNSSLLLDYYLVPSLAKKPGSTWTVDPQDVAGIVGAGFEASASGNLVVKRQDDVIVAEQKLARLSLEPESLVHMAFAEGGQKLNVDLEPKKSQLTYSIKDYLIREASIDWRISLTQVPRCLLLFGTTQIEAECKSHYEAQLEPKADAK